MCLVEHIFELCFSLNYGKKIYSTECLKICSASNIVLHAIPLGAVSSGMTDLFSGKKHNRAIFLKFVSGTEC